MDTKGFDKMVRSALADVPEPFRRYLDSVEVIVASAPTRVQRRALGLSGKCRETLYGLYEGVAVPDRVGGDAGLLPSIITLFRRPLAADFVDADDLRREVRRTLFHELAHHFGIDDDRLEELGAY